MLIAVMMWGDPELGNCEYLDQQLDTSYVTSLLAKVVVQKWPVRMDKE